MIALKYVLLALVFLSTSVGAAGQRRTAYKVVAYYSGDSTSLYQYDYSRITHLIYSFAHIKDGQLVLSSKKDTAAVLGSRELKRRYPHLKTLVALGGWGGCYACSSTFNDTLLTATFVATATKMLNDYDIDGIDLDWEYPAIPGPPGHPYLPQDRENFTRLIKMLRASLGNTKLITFAAGGFQLFLDSSVAWKKIAPMVDFVNLMSYDLVHGYSSVTGHHTPLFSARPKDESVANAIRFFRRIQFPLHKVVVGAAFYIRAFSVADNTTRGLYQPGKFLYMQDYKRSDTAFTAANGYRYHWDNTAKAAYWYNADKKIFVTGDTKKSIGLKCSYIMKNKLGGIMFWELPYDKASNGLLEAIRWK